MLAEFVQIVGMLFRTDESGRFDINHLQLGRADQPRPDRVADARGNAIDEIVAFGEVVQRLEMKVENRNVFVA